MKNSFYCHALPFNDSMCIKIWDFVCSIFVDVRMRVHLVDHWPPSHSLSSFSWSHSQLGSMHHPAVTSTGGRPLQISQRVVVFGANLIQPHPSLSPKRCFSCAQGAIQGEMSVWHPQVWLSLASLPRFPSTAMLCQAIRSRTRVKTEACASGNIQIWLCYRMLEHVADT